jgi:uncharacterized protein
MTDVERHEPGSFCWAELATTEPAAAKGFYGELFGWAAEDGPLPSGNVYTMLQLRGRNAAALYAELADERKMGIPPHWNCYVTVESADETARKVEAAGGKIVAPPFDVADAGRMAVFSDPDGAILSIWQPKRHPGAQVVNEPGTLCWVELATRDAAGAQAFYAAVFPWTAKPSPEYTEWHLGPRAIGGAMTIRAEWGPVPPHWLPYFMSADVDATTERAKRLGGGVRVPPSDVQSVGRFAVLYDSQGASFAIYRSARDGR